MQNVTNDLVILSYFKTLYLCFKNHTNLIIHPVGHTLKANLIKNISIDFSDNDDDFIILEYIYIYM
jgi:hypothetical protein